MDTAKIFQSGRSQAVRLPKAFRFSSPEVSVRHFGNGVLLLPLDNPWDTLMQGLEEFERGFVMERAEPPVQIRETMGQTQRTPKSAK